MKSKIILITSITTLIFTVIICLIIFWPSIQNTAHVNLQGYVHDRDGKPIANCKVAIFNCIILDDNAYARDKTVYAETDTDGHYEIEIEKSHLMYIRAYKKGCAIERSGAVQSKRELEQNFILNKGSDPESDLYKQNEVDDIIIQ